MSSVQTKNESREAAESLAGEKCLRAFHRLIGAVKIYQPDHQALAESVEAFYEAAAAWWNEEEYLTIRLSRERLLIQDEKLKYRRENINLVHELAQFLESRNIEGFRFYSSMKSVPAEFLEFIQLLNQAELQPDPLAWLREQMDARRFSWAEIVSGTGDSTEEGDLKRKEMAQRTYGCAVSSVKEVSDKIAANRRAGVRKLKRVVQNMMDILKEDESVLVFMSTIRHHDDYTFTHSVNVAILALCLGKRIGLSRTSLRRLGICGLVHDLGKVEIPLEILNKPGRLDDREKGEMERHPLKSAIQIIKLRASRDLKSKIMLPPFEHHLRYDLSGYPRIRRKKPISLFGRIIAIVDVFDALTSPRIYRKTAKSPDQALIEMFKGSGSDFDPILLKVFAGMLGVYPIGTLLKLDTGEMGLVREAAQELDRSRPNVVLLEEDGRGGYLRGGVVDLSERNPRTGQYRRNVAESFHPSVFGIQASEFLF